MTISSRVPRQLEYWLAILKVATIVVFFFLSIAVNVGGNQANEYIGAQYWTLGAAPFVNGFRGFASIFVTASFAYVRYRHGSLHSGALGLTDADLDARRVELSRSD